MTTAELGLVTTAVVGVAAAGAGALTAWANRASDRALARAGRLFEQRRGIYRDLGTFLELQRLIFTRVGQAIPVAAPPADLSDQEATALLGRAAVEGSREVQEKLAAYAKAAHRFLPLVMQFESMQRSKAAHGHVPEGYNEVFDLLEQTRRAVIEAIDAVEQTMREELEQL